MKSFSSDVTQSVCSNWYMTVECLDSDLKRKCIIWRKYWCVYMDLHTLSDSVSHMLYLDRLHPSVCSMESSSVNTLSLSDSMDCGYLSQSSRLWILYFRLRQFCSIFIGQLLVQLLDQRTSRAGVMMSFFSLTPNIFLQMFCLSLSLSQRSSVPVFMGVEVAAPALTTCAMQR